MHFKSSLRYFRMPCVLCRPPFTKLFDSKFVGIPLFRLSFHTDFRGIFGAHTFGKLALFFSFLLFSFLFFFSNYGEGLYFPRQPRDNLSKAILGVNFSCGFAFWKRFARQRWNISVHREKIFIKDIKVNNNPLSISFLYKFPLQILSIACL